MNHIISKLLIYGDMTKDSILMELSDICKKIEDKSETADVLTTRVLRQIKRILKIATDYGFDENLWHNYLTYILITDENPFTITCEKVGAGKGSVNIFAKNDFKAFMELFNYDFTDMERLLGINCFTVLSDYKATVKPELMYNKNVSEKVIALTGFYRDYGVGVFGLNKAFRIADGSLREQSEDSHTIGSIKFYAINNMDRVMLDDLIGYELQKKKLVENTEAFVEGRKANNVLLFGDSGTGKSTSIKAIVNQYYDRGLRLIEIYKHQFKELSNVIAAIKNRNYKFIIYMDDLSFEEFEIEYKFLKAVIEGGVETKPDNILIYATSNRRHLIKETWNDRDDVEMKNGIHKSDTMEEKLSLVNRFGVTISYEKPSQREYFDIVTGLAKREGLNIDDDTLKAEANKWELSHGGISGRTAKQFINYLLGKISD